MNSYQTYDQMMDIDLQKQRDAESQRRLTKLQEQYSGVPMDEKMLGEFQNLYRANDKDPTAAFEYLEGGLKARQRELQDKQIEQQKHLQQRNYGGLAAVDPTNQAEVLRNYRMRIEELKDRIPGLNVPTGFFEEQAARMEKPWALHQAGSYDRLKKQEVALQNNLQRLFNDVFGIEYDLTRNMGWEELLKDLFRRLK